DGRRHVEVEPPDPLLLESVVVTGAAAHGVGGIAVLDDGARRGDDGGMTVERVRMIEAERVSEFMGEDARVGIAVDPRTRRVAADRRQPRKLAGGVEREG